jgi:hypothetical protein
LSLTQIWAKKTVFVQALHSSFSDYLASAISSYLRILFIYELETSSAQSDINVWALDTGNENGPHHGLQTETLFTFHHKPGKLVTQIENVK